MSAVRPIEQYVITEHELLAALRLKDRKELGMLSQPHAGLVGDLVWSCAAGATGLIVAVGASGGGAWIGALVLAASLLAAVVAFGDERPGLAALLGVVALGGLIAAIARATRGGLGVLWLAGAVGVLVAGAVFSALRGVREISRCARGAVAIRRLLRDVQRFHDAVELARVQAELADQRVGPEPSAKLHEALASTRSTLVRALSVEAVLRSHKAVLRRAADDPAGRLFPVHAERLEAEARQCADALATDLEALAEARLELDGESRKGL